MIRRATIFPVAVTRRFNTYVADATAAGHQDLRTQEKSTSRELVAPSIWTAPAIESTGAKLGCGRGLHLERLPVLDRLRGLTKFQKVAGQLAQMGPHLERRRPKELASRFTALTRRSCISGRPKLPVGLASPKSRLPDSCKLPCCGFDEWTRPPRPQGDAMHTLSAFARENLRRYSPTFRSWRK